MPSSKILRGVFSAFTESNGTFAVIAVSPAMREDVLRAYPALDPARVHVILGQPEEAIEQLRKQGHDLERDAERGLLHAVTP